MSTTITILLASISTLCRRQLPIYFSLQYFGHNGVIRSITCNLEPRMHALIEMEKCMQLSQYETSRTVLAKDDRDEAKSDTSIFCLHGRVHTLIREEILWEPIRPRTALHQLWYHVNIVSTGGPPGIEMAA